MVRGKKLVLFTLMRPTDGDVRKAVEIQAALPHSYREAGATLGGRLGLPADATIDQNRTRLGQGDEVFEAACEAVKRWRMFDMPWVELVPPAEIEEGACAVLLTRTFGLWSANVSRIVYRVDEENRFGFAYGTLPQHAESGEERFLVERDADGSVFYDILAFSRVKHPLVRLFAPLARSLQSRFARDSMAAMRCAAVVPFGA